MTFNYWPKGSSVAQTVKCNGNDVGSLEIISDIWYSYLSFFYHNLSKIKIDSKSNDSSLSVILKKEHCQTHMLTNNNLHKVRIGYKKTKTEEKQVEGKRRNIKRYLYPSLVSLPGGVAR